MHIKTQRGASLIEVLVSVIILSVGVLALAGFTGNLYRSVTHAGDRAEALTLAQRYIENARTKGAATLTSGAVTSPADCTTNEFHTYWKVATVDGANGVKHYSVNVCWTNSLGEEQVLTTSTYIGTGSTALELGAPAATTAPSKCSTTAYTDMAWPNRYSAGQVVSIGGKNYTCIAEQQLYCGDSAYKPGSLYGPVAWGNGITCTP